ncbi:hypothetical protein NA57DRAFT_59406 [Rhizodiscina lignyota]|uniref:Zn(2)-C6 fungal-type domain-containing protein n=1 Tax=Rhizodiscina lignyota TaxID=1504668 RepID=A0A9P4I920_9PEZI|nr:hypothetical protein NA57DRAFT_59406 [Rhizodiscina lignyota]
MFLITPKPKSHPHDTSPTEAGRPHIPPRVKQACIRCRIRKVKCDGQVPCRRCTRDQVNCQLDRRNQADIKEVSRTYISSLETQQRYLLDALRQLCERPNTQESSIRNIVERLEASGVEVDFLRKVDSGTGHEVHGDQEKISMRIPGYINWTDRFIRDAGQELQSQIPAGSRGQQKANLSAPSLNDSAMAISEVPDLAVPTSSFGESNFPIAAFRPNSAPDASLTSDDWTYVNLDPSALSTLQAPDQPSTAFGPSSNWPQGLPVDDTTGMDNMLAFDSPDYANAWWENWTNVLERISAAENNPNVLVEANNSSVTPT